SQPRRAAVGGRDLLSGRLERRQGLWRGPRRGLDVSFPSPRARPDPRPARGRQARVGALPVPGVGVPRRARVGAGLAAGALRRRRRRLRERRAAPRALPLPLRSLTVLRVEERAAMKHFSMIRDFHLADLFTLANGGSGTAALFLAMDHVREARVAKLYAAGAFVAAALVFDVMDGRVARWRHRAS